MLGRVPDKQMPSGHKVQQGTDGSPPRPVCNLPDQPPDRKRVVLWHGFGRDRPSETAGSDVVSFPISEIEWDQPETTRRPDVESLAASLAEHGQLQPVLLRWCTRNSTQGPKPYCKAVFGAIRLSAAVIAEWTHIQARILDGEISDDQARLLRFVENTHRSNVADGTLLDTLVDLRAGFANNKVLAKAIARSEAYISKKLRVAEDVLLRDAIARGNFSLAVAEEFLILERPARDLSVVRAMTSAARGEQWTLDRARSEVARALLLDGGRDAPAAAEVHAAVDFGPKSPLRSLSSAIEESREDGEAVQNGADNFSAQHSRGYTDFGHGDQAIIAAAESLLSVRAVSHDAQPHLQRMRRHIDWLLGDS